MVSHCGTLPVRDTSYGHSCESPRTEGGSTDGLAKAIFCDEAFTTETVATLARTSGCSAIALGVACKESQYKQGNHKSDLDAVKNGA